MKQSIGRFFGITEKPGEQVKQIPVDLILPNPYQPRTVFDDEKLEELCQTIRIHGIIQPIVVRRKGKQYELIAGERRLRAMKKLNFPTIPAIVKEMSDRQAASAALIENLQREGLTAIEEAYAYQKLIELHRMTQETLAQRLGKGQSTIANKLRLLQLPQAVQDALLQRKITERHARCLLMLKEEELQLKLLEEIIEKELNVKQTEEKVKKVLAGTTGKRKKNKRKSYSRDLRIAVNTIRQSIDMIKEAGMQVLADERDEEDFYELVIRIPK